MHLNIFSFKTEAIPFVLLVIDFRLQLPVVQRIRKDMKLVFFPKVFHKPRFISRATSEYIYEVGNLP